MAKAMMVKKLQMVCVYPTEEIVMCNFFRCAFIFMNLTEQNGLVCSDSQTGSFCVGGSYNV